nr:CD99 antigen-like isoform X1 [Chlorocebus sabaeus]
MLMNRLVFLSFSFILRHENPWRSSRLTDDAVFSFLGSFSDADLADGVSGGEGKGGGDGGGSHRKEGEEADAPGVIPGIVGAVVVAVAGAISSFIAYQKKKLCFKENAEQGEVDMESHRNANAEPAVQRTLLEK